MDISTIGKKALQAFVKNSPAILTGLGVGGFVTTVILTAKGAPQAKKVHDWHSERRRESLEKMPPKTNSEKAKRIFRSAAKEAKDLAPLYGPAAAMGGVSLICFLGANKIQADRQAALMAAYSLSEKTLTTYQKKVIEKLGEDMHEEVLSDTTREIVKESKIPDGRHSVEDGRTRCYDNVTGRYFYCNKETILQAESEMNKRLLSEGRVYLQDFYYEMGLEERFALGDSMGWDISLANGEHVLNVWFTPMLDDEKNPCLALNYHVTIFDRSA